MNQLLRRVRYLLNRRRFDRELAADLDFHREMAARERGMPVGNTLLLREEARDAWGWTWIDRLFQDLRYAARTLRKSPGFTLAAVLMLAIGIGVNVAAFGFFDLMVLKPLPVRDPATLLRFERRAPDRYWSDLPYVEMAFFRQNSKTLSAVLASATARLAIGREEKPVNAHFVTANFFSELGAASTIGRVLDSALDEAPGAEAVAVLSDGFWRSHFAADPLIIGKSIRLNTRAVTVIGVVSSEFGGFSLDSPDLWLPINQHPQLVTGSRLLTDLSPDGQGVKMWGRLQPGLTPKPAEEELRMLAAELRLQYPTAIWENETLPSEPGGYALGQGGNRRGTGTPQSVRSEMLPILALAGSLVFLILAVTCGNLGSLLLARGVAREREISIRVAVGAGSGRLVRQLFTESLVLALLGSAAGLALGYVVMRYLMVLSDAPSWLNPTPDWRVIAFALATGFAAAVLFGLTPALHVARRRHSATTMRQILIGAQVAGSCVLLIVAGLLVRALNHIASAHPGFDYEQVLSIDPGLAAHGYSPETARAYLDTLQSRLRALPGVESVSLTSTPPLGHRTTVLRSNTDGRIIDTHMFRVDTAFFETMRIPLVRGRTFVAGEKRAVIVSQSYALRQWPGEDPLGKTFDNTFTVIGVTRSARLVALRDPDAVEAYYLAEAGDLPSVVVLVKTSAAPDAIASVARSIDPKIFPEIQLLKSSFADKLREARYTALAVGVLGFVALLLACLGILGLVAYAVSQRTKEIGLRMALGATRAHVLSIVLRQFSRPVVAGLIVGIAIAAGLSQILRRQLYGVSNLDPIAYLAAIAVFVVTVVVSALIPARRALRVDPMRALRYE